MAIETAHWSSQPRSKPPTRWPPT